MAKLTMHNRLPFDDATAQAMVSTGGLPGDEEVRGAASEAFERYRATTEGVVADYIPALADASPDLFGISLAGVRGRTFDIGDTDTSFSIQSCPNRSSSRWSARASATRRHDNTSG